SGSERGEQPLSCNGDDRRLRRKQGGAVGAAVSRTRVPPKARSGRWVPQPVGSSASKSLVVFWFSFGTQKRTISLNEKALSPAHQRDNHFWFSFGTQKRT
ncbi:MAG: hypothetical protein ACLUQ1_02805, partial [Faecalibacterium prausnitzii]